MARQHPPPGFLRAALTPRGDSIELGHERREFVRHRFELIAQSRRLLRLEYAQAFCKSRRTSCREASTKVAPIASFGVTVNPRSADRGSRLRNELTTPRDSAPHSRPRHYEVDPATRAATCILSALLSAPWVIKREVTSLNADGGRAEGNSRGSVSPAPIEKQRLTLQPFDTIGT